MVKKKLQKGQPVKDQHSKNPLRKESFGQPKKSSVKNIYLNFFGIVAIVFIGTIIYSNSFNCSFHLDDSKSIVENPVIRNLSDVKTLWNYHSRFIPYLSFAINYHFDQLNVWEISFLF